MGVNFGQAISAGAGFVGTNLAAAQLLKFLPAQMTADPNTSNLVRIGVKAAVTIGGTMLLRRSPLRGFASAWAIGGGVATVVDALTTFVLPALNLADYQEGALSAYQGGMLQGYGDPFQSEGFGDAYGEGVYG